MPNELQTQFDGVMNQNDKLQNWYVEHAELICNEFCDNIVMSEIDMFVTNWPPRPPVTQQCLTKYGILRFNIHPKTVLNIVEIQSLVKCSQLA